MTPGPLLFARYAYPPNSLGYCGADETRTLLEYGAAGASDGGLAGLARTFEGAWPYLTLIAEANMIDDPLDSRVVEAYWVGNGLLVLVPLARPTCAARRGSLPRPPRTGPGITSSTLSRPVRSPHHSFHVFAVDPWLGLLRTGIVDRAAPCSRPMSDDTRLSSRRSGATTGRVVLARPLVWNGRHAW